MPTKAPKVIAIASQKNYVSVYTCDATKIEAFKQVHPEIRTGKGCINLKDKDELPLQALDDVIAKSLGYPKLFYLLINCCLKYSR